MLSRLLGGHATVEEVARGNIGVPQAATAAANQFSSALMRCRSAVNALDPGLKKEMQALMTEIEGRLAQRERRHRGPTELFMTPDRVAELSYALRQPTSSRSG